MMRTILRAKSVLNHKFANGLVGMASFRGVYDPIQEGTWRLQVEKCTCFTCPLVKCRSKSEYKNK